MTAAQQLARALTDPPTGKRSKHKRTARKYAERLGHALGKFKARRYSAPGMGGRIMYHVAWCTLCGDAAFTTTPSHDAGPNAALDRVCRGSE